MREEREAERNAERLKAMLAGEVAKIEAIAAEMGLESKVTYAWEMPTEQWGKRVNEALGVE